MGNVPEGQKNAFLVRAILHEDQSSRLEEMLRRTVREELQSIRLDENSRKTVREEHKNARLEKMSVTREGESSEGKIPEQMLDFLSRME